MSAVVIVLTVVLLVASLAATQSSKLTVQKKQVVLLAVLGIFTAILVSQKLKEPALDQSVLEISQTSYRFPAEGEFALRSEYEIADVPEYLDLIENRLEIKIEKSGKGGAGFYVVEGAAHSGKTYSFLSLLKRLREDGLRTFYVDFRNLNAKSNEQLNLANFLRYNQYLNVRDAFVKYNKNGETPVVLIDHFEEIFLHADSQKKCFVCLALTQLYHENNVQIIVLTNNPYTRKLFTLNGGNKYSSFKQFSRTNAQQLQLVRTLASQSTDAQGVLKKYEA